MKAPKAKVTFKPMVNIPKGQTIGSPMKQPYTPGKNPAWVKGAKSKKMSAAQVATRKKSMVANAAGKVMGGLYSK